jgi:hypothetical protein
VSGLTGTITDNKLMDVLSEVVRLGRKLTWVRGKENDGKSFEVFWICGSVNFACG